MVKGSRVPVRRLFAWHKQGTSVDTLTKRYPYLGWANILDALAFGYDNPELMKAGSTLVAAPRHPLRHGPDRARGAPRTRPHRRPLQLRPAPVREGSAADQPGAGWVAAMSLPKPDLTTPMGKLEDAGVEGARCRVTVPGAAVLDMVGRRFGRLLVLQRSSDGRGPRWLCRCDCGASVVLPGGNLRRGNTKSCGCLRRDRRIADNLKHGMRGSPEYRSWASMHQRCLDKSSDAWPNYGGRGITICAGWLDDFANFFAVMGARPSLGHSLDRIDNSGGYFCGRCDECVAQHRLLNCRWATRKEQANNRRARKPKIDDEAAALIRRMNPKGPQVVDAARHYGVSTETIYVVLRQGGRKDVA